MNPIDAFDWLVELAPGLGVTILLTGALLGIGLPLGVMLGLGLRNPSAAVRWLSIAVVEIARGIPALVMLYVFYFGLPSVGLVLDAFPAAALALGLGFAGYTSEVFKSGFDAVPTGQHEASRALALPRTTTFFRIVAPQAMRIITPPLLGFIVSFLQATSLAFAIGVSELMMRGQSIALQNFDYLEVFTVVGILYAIVSLPVVLFAERLSEGRRRAR